MNPLIHQTARCAALCALAACGCRSGGSDLMPMRVGRSWTYVVKAGFDTYVAPIKVVREIAVANTSGFELGGTLGSSRLAWSGNGLVVERLINTQFAPPLPLVFDAEETHERQWKGRVTFVERASPATAVQSQSPDDGETFAGRKIHCIRSTVKLRTASRSIELLTWFSPGLGIVRQEQRTDGILVISLKLLEEQE